jgi:MFS family permease
MHPSCAFCCSQVACISPPCWPAPFALYLLRDLHFSYLQYSAWASAAIIGGFLALNGWGRISDRYGNRKLLVGTGFGLPILPMLHLVTEEAWWLIVINGVAGIVWSGFNLGLQNIVYDLVQSEERAAAVAVSNEVIATAAFLGTMAGGGSAPWRHRRSRSGDSTYSVPPV